MAVRDTTAWRHARISRKVINMDRGGTNVMCAWDTCELDGYENNKVVTHTTKNNDDERNIVYVFCTERHKAYWLESIKPGRGNQLPPGWRTSIM